MASLPRLVVLILLVGGFARVDAKRRRYRKLGLNPAPPPAPRVAGEAAGSPAASEATPEAATAAAADGTGSGELKFEILPTEKDPQQRIREFCAKASVR